jgi:SHS2 domain-containing protein
MPYRFLEDTAIADIAFEATGKSLEELFQSAADAVINVMISDINTIALKESRSFQEKNAEIDLLLFDFLQEVIFYKDSKQLLLRAQKVNIQRVEGEYQLSAVLKGEFLDPQKHEQRVDVKAVTLHQFYIKEVPQGWLAHVILDI